VARAFFAGPEMACGRARASLRGLGWVAALAALAATAGDLGQLWVVNAARPALALPAPPPGVIVVATLAGALAIPLYALGYFARAERARAAAPTVAAVVTIAGAAFAVLGGLVHATTGVLVATGAGGIAGGLDPLAGILASGPIVLSLWALATVAFLCAAIAEASLPQPPAARCFNPAVLTLVLTAAATLAPSPWRDFLAPAAVNVAHLVFFVRLGLLQG
jgi:hypothetical protein